MPRAQKACTSLPSRWLPVVRPREYGRLASWCFCKEPFHRGSTLARTCVLRIELEQRSVIWTTMGVLVAHGHGRRWLNRGVRRISRAVDRALVHSTCCCSPDRRPLLGRGIGFDLLGCGALGRISSPYMRRQWYTNDLEQGSNVSSGTCTLLLWDGMMDRWNAFASVHCVGNEVVLGAEVGAMISSGRHVDIRVFRFAFANAAQGLQSRHLPCDKRRRLLACVA